MANSYVLLAAALCVLVPLAQWARAWWHNRVFARTHGCQPAPMDRLLTWLDPLGVGILFELERRLASHSLLDYMRTRFEDNGYTFKSRVLLDDFYWTCEPRNIQALLATQFHSFGVGIDRYNNFKPLMGHGIFTSDGAKWEQARALVRPNFVRDQVADLESFEVHFQNMLALIPKDGTTPVHLKELFQRMTLDSASEMLFGESLNTLTNDDNQVASAQFAAAFKRSQTELARRCRLGRLADWNVSQDFLDACRFTQRFVDGYVEKAMRVRARHLDRQARGEKAPREAEEEKGRYVFLEELALRVDDPVAVRDHLLNVLIPARDSTSTLLAAAVFAIAKDPHVLRRLQDEVRELGGAHPSFERLKNMKYLKWVMNESRSWAVVAGVSTLVVGMLTNATSSAPLAHRTPQRAAGVVRRDVAGGRGPGRTIADPRQEGPERRVLDVCDAPAAGYLGRRRGRVPAGAVGGPAPRVGVPALQRRAAHLHRPAAGPHRGRLHPRAPAAVLPRRRESRPQRVARGPGPGLRHRPARDGPAGAVVGWRGSRMHGYRRGIGELAEAERRVARVRGPCAGSRRNGSLCTTRHPSPSTRFLPYGHRPSPSHTALAPFTFDEARPSEPRTVAEQVRCPTKLPKPFSHASYRHARR